MHYSYVAFYTFFEVIKQREFLYYLEVTIEKCSRTVTLFIHFLTYYLYDYCQPEINTRHNNLQFIKLTVKYNN